jgi:hypothetical protein
MGKSTMRLSSRRPPIWQIDEDEFEQLPADGVGNAPNRPNARSSRRSARSLWSGDSRLRVRPAVNRLVADPARGANKTKYLNASLPSPLSQHFPTGLHWGYIPRCSWSGTWSHSLSPRGGRLAPSPRTHHVVAPGGAGGDLTAGTPEGPAAPAAPRGPHHAIAPGRCGAAWRQATRPVCGPVVPRCPGRLAWTHTMRTSGPSRNKFLVRRSRRRYPVP